MGHPEGGEGVNTERNTMNNLKQIPIGDRPASQLTIRQYVELQCEIHELPQSLADRLLARWEGVKFLYWVEPYGNRVYASRGKGKAIYRLDSSGWVSVGVNPLDDESASEHGWKLLDKNPHPTGEVPE